MPSVYITSLRDSWDAIAFRLWGREDAMDLLLDANPDYRDVLLFPAGIRLAVPDITPLSRSMELPPWITRQ